MMLRETVMKRWDAAPCTMAECDALVDVAGHSDFLAIVTRMTNDGEIIYRNIAINGDDEIVVTVLFLDEAKCNSFEDEHVNLPWAKEMRIRYDINVSKATV